MILYGYGAATTAPSRQAGVGMAVDPLIGPRDVDKHAGDPHAPRDAGPATGGDFLPGPLQR
ncbi:hypothetical protein CP969_30625 [Streptomyces viridosporus T7A]|uniref:Uncharacterized protein n=1 Tax=Streptomyces viridosporus T7A TaxID=665577 RepID=A0ABX6AL11_STRVD|nr:hypothetical protein CP969_30625 [Streptomyces viridosporus T7A]